MCDNDMRESENLLPPMPGAQPEESVHSHNETNWRITVFRPQRVQGIHGV